MIRFRPLWVMTITTIVALVALIMLGRWQWERYQSKLAAAIEPVAEMTIEGYQPIPDGLQFVYGVRPDTHEPGWRVFAPLQYGDTIVFVDADFLPFVSGEAPSADEVRLPSSLRFGAPISGASIRPSEGGAMSAPPRPLQRLWYTTDIAAMGRNAGVENVADYYIAAPYVGADGRAVENPFALAPGADPLPPERHLGYALTWYGLAVVLLGVYFAYHVSVGRLVFHLPRPRRD